MARMVRAKNLDCPGCHSTSIDRLITIQESSQEKQTARTPSFERVRSSFGDRRKLPITTPSEEAIAYMQDSRYYSDAAPMFFTFSEPPIDLSGLNGPLTEQAREDGTAPVGTCLCCPVKGGLNVSGQLKCPNVGFYNAQLRRLLGDEPGINLFAELGEVEPLWGLTTAGCSVPANALLYEVYCSLDFDPPNKECCLCTAKQSLVLGEDANDALIADVHSALTKQYRDETQRLGPRRAENPRNRLNRLWNPKQNVMKGVSYQDYIEPWVTCCKRGGQWFIAFVDAPGPFSAAADGTIHFTVVFSEGGASPRSICRCQSVEVRYDFIVRKPAAGQQTATYTVKLHDISCNETSLYDPNTNPVPNISASCSLKPGKPRERGPTRGQVDEARQRIEDVKKDDEAKNGEK